MSTKSILLVTLIFAVPLMDIINVFSEYSG